MDTCRTPNPGIVFFELCHVIAYPLLVSSGCGSARAKIVTEVPINDPTRIPLVHARGRVYRERTRRTQNRIAIMSLFPLTSTVSKLFQYIDASRLYHWTLAPADCDILLKLT